MTDQAKQPELQGKHTDTLIALVERGPLWDGDVPSKSARDDLLEWGYASKAIVNGEHGYQVATYSGGERYSKLFGCDTVQEAMAKRKAEAAAKRVFEEQTIG